MNQVILLGRLKEINDGMIKIEVTGNFKEDGEYRKDILEVWCISTIFEKIEEYCREEDMISVKGRITVTEDSQMMIIGEQVSFLRSEAK